MGIALEYSVLLSPFYRLTMQNFTIEYTDVVSWQNFVNTHGLTNKENILLQIFSPAIGAEHLATKVKDIQQVLPKAIIIGCTSDGGILDKSVVGDKRVLLLISVFENTQLTAQHWQLTEDHLRVGELAAKSLVQSNTKAMIAFADGLKANGEDLLNGINNIAPSVPVAGGLAGDDWRFEQTFVIHQDRVLENALVMVALNSDTLQVNSDYLFEWQPVGKVMSVSKAIKNQLFELDNKSVQEVYCHYLGLSDDDDFMACAAEFPLMILRDNMTLARCPLAMGEDGSMYFAGNFTEKDQVQFCYAHSHHIQKAHAVSMQRMLSKPVEAAFIYSCAARKHFIPEQVSEEVRQYQQFADVGGVFLYGEFFHRQDKHAFLNHTLTALFLSESAEGHKQENIPDKQASGIENNTMNRLFNLIEATSTEINQLNWQLTEEVEKKSKQLLEQQARLQQAQKMEAIGQLTGGIAHDFNNILASIMGYSQLASEQFSSGNAQLGHYLHTINNASERARDMISNMLAFSRHRSRNPQLTRADKVLEETLALLAPTIPSSINLTFDCAQNLAAIMLDPTQLQQVVMNLVINSRDALYGKGNINITLDIRENTVQHCNSCFAKFSGSFLKLTVKDDGPGIPDQNLARIFEPFFTTKSSEKGSGMGLSVIHGIVHAHGGHIKVGSIPYQQTAISLYFPYQAGEVAEKQAKENKSELQASSLADKTILIVDDEPLVADFLASYLSYHHFEVITAENGRMALEKLNEHCIDLIITDQTMPEMTGIELSQAVRGLFPHLPIILSSGYSDEVGEHNFHKFGINLFLKKPSKTEELIHAINKLL